MQERIAELLHQNNSEASTSASGAYPTQSPSRQGSGSSSPSGSHSRIRRTRASSEPERPSLASLPPAKAPARSSQILGRQYRRHEPTDEEADDADDDGEDEEDEDEDEEEEEDDDEEDEDSDDEARDTFGSLEDTTMSGADRTAIVGSTGAGGGRKASISLQLFKETARGDHHHESMPLPSPSKHAAAPLPSAVADVESGVQTAPPSLPGSPLRQSPILSTSSAPPVELPAQGARSPRVFVPSATGASSPSSRASPTLSSAAYHHSLSAMSPALAAQNRRFPSPLLREIQQHKSSYFSQPQMPDFSLPTAALAPSGSSSGTVTALPTPVPIDPLGLGLPHRGDAVETLEETAQEYDTPSSLGSTASVEVPISSSLHLISSPPRDLLPPHHHLHHRHSHAPSSTSHTAPPSPRTGTTTSGPARPSAITSPSADDGDAIALARGGADARSLHEMVESLALASPSAAGLSAAVGRRNQQHRQRQPSRTAESDELEVDTLHRTRHWAVDGGAGVASTTSSRAPSRHSSRPPSAQRQTPHRPKGTPAKSGGTRTPRRASARQNRSRVRSASDASTSVASSSAVTTGSLLSTDDEDSLADDDELTDEYYDDESYDEDEEYVDDDMLSSSAASESVFAPSSATTTSTTEDEGLHRAMHISPGDRTAREDDDDDSLPEEDEGEEYEVDVAHLREKLQERGGGTATMALSSRATSKPAIRDTSDRRESRSSASTSRASKSRLLDQQGRSVASVPLEPFNHQVGGHSHIFRFSKKAVCKVRLPASPSDHALTWHRSRSRAARTSSTRRSKSSAPTCSRLCRSTLACSTSLIDVRLAPMRPTTLARRRARAVKLVIQPR